MFSEKYAHQIGKIGAFVFRTLGSLIYRDVREAAETAAAKRRRALGKSQRNTVCKT
jgi:hypothetical protein